MNIKDQELRTQALVFYEEDMNAIEAILDAFLKKSQARCGILVDKDGHAITARGDTRTVDLDTISALVAGSFAATKALAHQFGEADFTALFHQGRGGNIQMSLVGERALLTALFADNTTIGMVRLYASEAAKRLTDLFRRKEQAPTARPPGGNGSSEDEGEKAEFEKGSAGVLDQLFGG